MMRAAAIDVERLARNENDAVAKGVLLHVARSHAQLTPELQATFGDVESHPACRDRIAQRVHHRIAAAAMLRAPSDDVRVEAAGPDEIGDGKPRQVSRMRI